MTNQLTLWERVMFRLTFGIWPSIPTEPLALKAKQEVVDSKLQSLALEFAFADLDERRYQDQIAGEQAWSAYQTLKEVKRRLRRVKKAFWNTHRLAKRAGFRARKKFSDYLKPSSFYFGGIPVTKQHTRPPDYILTKDSIARLDKVGTSVEE